MKNISELQNFWHFWIFGSWTQSGAWDMIVPFWSWNLSDKTHERSHTKFQLIWAINTAFTRGGGWFSSLKCGAGTPSLLGLNYLKTWLFSKGQNKLGLKFIKLSLSGVFWNFQDCHRDFSNWCFIGWVIPSKRFSSIMAPTVWSINDL